MNRRDPKVWMRTIQVALPTPFDASGKRLVAENLSRHVAALASAGINGFLPAAGTGEFHSLTAAEVEACVAATRAAAKDRAVVVGPVGFSLDETIERGQRLRDAGADALLIMPPIHPYVADTGFEAFMRAVQQATGMPLLVYKKAPVPSDATLARLIAEGVLTGVKYAINDMAAVAAFAERIGDAPSLQCGTGERYAPFYLMAGAVGFSSGVANLCPRLSLSMLDAVQRGDFSHAMRIMRLVRPIEDIRAREGDALSVGLLKLMMRRAGLDFGPSRPPLRDATAVEEREIIAALEPILAAEASTSMAAD